MEGRHHSQQLARLSSQQLQCWLLQVPLLSLTWVMLGALVLQCSVRSALQMLMKCWAEQIL